MEKNRITGALFEHFAFGIPDTNIFPEAYSHAIN